MRRTLALLVIAVFALQMPLSAMPAAAIHDPVSTEPENNRDVLQGPDTACSTSPSDTNCTFKLSVGSSFIYFRRDTTTTSDPTDYIPQLPTGVTTMPLINEGHTLSLVTRFGTSDQAPPAPFAGECHDDVGEANNQVSRRVTFPSTTNTVTGTGSGNGQHANVNVEVLNVDVTPSTETESAASPGYRTVSLSVKADVYCVEPGVRERHDKTWTAVLKDIRIDNTLPAIANPTADPDTFWLRAQNHPTIAKVGDTFRSTLTINDGDWPNSAVCDDYVISLPFSRFSNLADTAIDWTDFFVSGPNTCAATISAPVTGTVLGFASGDAGFSNAYDYDIVPWSTNRVRIGGASSITGVGFIPTVTVVDEAGNSKAFNMNGLLGTPPLPRIDAVRPTVIPTSAINVAATGSGVSLTIANTSLAYDVVGFEADFKCVVVSAACSTTDWQPMGTCDASGAPVACPTFRRAPTGTTWPTAYVLTKSFADAVGDIHVRVRAVDDAGNRPSVAGNADGWTVRTKTGTDDTTGADIEITLTAPDIGLFDRSDRPLTPPATVDDAEFAPFDGFRINVRDADNGMPTTGTPVKVRMWRLGAGNQPDYWDNTLGAFQGSTLRENSATRVSPTSDNPLGTIQYRWDLNSCVNNDNTCLGTGTYFVQVVATDAGGNVAEAAAVALRRDIRSPEFPSGSGTNKIVFPTGSTGNVQQGSFLRVNLTATDVGSGLRQVRFAFVPSSTTQARHDLAVDTVFGADAVACMGLHTTSPTNPIAYARIPASGTCSDLSAEPLDLSPSPVAGSLTANTYFLCKSSAPTTCTDYQSGLRGFARGDVTTTDSECAGLGSGTSTWKTCYPAPTPDVLVSTDGVPFGSYRLNVQLLDWAGRQRNQTFVETFTIVPRVAVPGDVVPPWGCGTTTFQDCLQGNKRFDNGKINLTIFAGYTDDRDASNAVCPEESHTATTIPTRTATCSPLSVVVDYLPANKPAQESNYVVLKTWSFPPPPVVAFPSTASEEEHYEGSPEFAAYRLIEDGVKFYRFELRNFTPPSSAAPLPEPPVVRVSVKGKIGTTEVTERLPPVQLSGRPVPSSISPLKPLTAWTSTREPTIFEGPGTTRTAGTPADVWFQFAFQKPGLPPLDTAVFVRVWDHNLSLVKIPITYSNTFTAAGSGDCPTVTTFRCYNLPEPGVYAVQSLTGTVGGSARTFTPGTDYVVEDGVLKFRIGASATNPTVGSTFVLTYTAHTTVAETFVDDLEQLGGLTATSYKGGAYYYRVSAVYTKAAAVPFEGPHSRLVIGRVDGTDADGIPLVGTEPTSADTAVATCSPANVAVDVPASPTFATATATLTWDPPAASASACAPASYALSGYRVYRGYILDETTSDVGESAPTRFDCDVERPSNPLNPCRLVFWANATADNRGRGHNWSAFVNVSDHAGIEAAQNPDDPDHHEAFTSHDPLVAPTSRARHGLGTFAWRDHEFNLTRGEYVLEVTAHRKPATPVDDPAEILDLPELGYFARMFQVETRQADLRVAAGAGDVRTDSAGTSWTDSTLSVHVCVDARNFVTAERRNVTAALVLGSTGETIPGVSSTVRTLDPTTVERTLGTLSSAITTTSTSLQVVGTGFSSTGAVLVESERITYTGASVSGGVTTLTGLGRGAAGTTAAGHAADVDVRALGCPTDGVELPQAYNVTVFIPPYSHGESFRVVVNLAPDAIAVPGSVPAKGTTSTIVSLDLRGPTLSFRMGRLDPLAAVSRANTPDGAPRTTLATALTATAGAGTTIDVADASLLPRLGVLKIDNEYIRYAKDASGTPKIAARHWLLAAGSGAAAAHAVGATVSVSPYLLHGVASEDGIGSGIRSVEVAIERLKDTRGRVVSPPEFWDPARGGFERQPENLPRWLNATIDADGVWVLPNHRGDGAPIIGTTDNLTYFRVWARAKDLLGNTGGPITATPTNDARAPVFVANRNDTAPVSTTSGTPKAHDPRYFATWVSDNDGTQAVDVKVHLIAPNGRLYIHNMTVSTTGPCAAAGASSMFGAAPTVPTKCYAVELGLHDDDEPLELDWAGEYRYYFHARDTAGNTWCSFGPCTRAIEPDEHPLFVLADDGPPRVDKRPCNADKPLRPCVSFSPPFGAPGGVVSVNAYIQEAAGFLEGYPRAAFYLNGTQIGNGTMRNASANSVDPAAGFGTWALNTFEAGVGVLQPNTRICAVIFVRDESDNFATTGNEAGNPGCPNSFTVLENAPPFITLVSPASGGWVGANPRVEFKVEDVNVDPSKFVLTVQPEGGTARTDSARLVKTPVRVGGSTVSWNVVYNGANLTDRGNVTFSLDATDNFTITNRSSVRVRVDADLPSVEAQVRPVATGTGGRNLVGPGTLVRLSGSDLAGGSGLGRVEYRVNGGSWTTYSEPFAPTGGDTFRLEYAAVDVAGNRKEGNALTYDLDKQGPTVSVVRSGTNTTITAVDGLTDIDVGNVTLFYKTSATATDFRAFPFDHVTGNTYAANVGALTGTFVYYVEVKDILGNVGYAQVDGKTCRRDTPCGLSDTTRGPPTIAIVAPAEDAVVSAATPVRWTASAFDGASVEITVEVADATRRLVVAQGATDLTGSRTLDPAALNLTAGEWRLIVTIDDGVNAPVEAQRTITVQRTTSAIGQAAVPFPRGGIDAGAKYETDIPVTNADKEAVTVVATITRGGAFLRNETFTVTDGKIAFAFSETTPGSYAVALTVRYADGSSDPPVSAGVFTVKSAVTSPTEPAAWPFPTLLAAGAIVIVLAGIGAFGRWRK